MIGHCLTDEQKGLTSGLAALNVAVLWVVIVCGLVKVTTFTLTGYLHFESTSQSCPEYRGNIFLQNVGNFLPDYTLV